jgi:hypothetical protein
MATYATVSQGQNFGGSDEFGQREPSWTECRLCAAITAVLGGTAGYDSRRSGVTFAGAVVGIWAVWG